MKKNNLKMALAAICSSAILCFPFTAFALEQQETEAAVLPITEDTIEDGTYNARILSADSQFEGSDVSLTVTGGQLILTVSKDGEECLVLDLGTARAGASSEASDLEPVIPMSVDKKDGEYSVDVTLEGGSGKATVTSPTVMIVKDGQSYARLEWSSANYDYMIVGCEKYLPVNNGGNSVFEIPIAVMDEAMPVIADTIAMGDPHEIRYNLTFFSDSIGSKSELPQEAAKRVLIIALVIIVGGGILNHFVNKKRRV